MSLPGPDEHLVDDDGDPIPDSGDYVSFIPDDPVGAVEHVVVRLGGAPRLAVEALRRLALPPGFLAHPIRFLACLERDPDYQDEADREAHLRDVEAALAAGKPAPLTMQEETLQGARVAFLRSDVPHALAVLDAPADAIALAVAAVVSAVDIAGLARACGIASELPEDEGSDIVNALVARRGREMSAGVREALSGFADGAPLRETRGRVRDLLAVAPHEVARAVAPAVDDPRRPTARRERIVLEKLEAAQGKHVSEDALNRALEQANPPMARSARQAIGALRAKRWRIEASDDGLGYRLR